MRPKKKFFFSIKGTEPNQQSNHVQNFASQLYGRKKTKIIKMKRRMNQSSAYKPKVNSNVQTKFQLIQQGTIRQNQWQKDGKEKKKSIFKFHP